MTSVSSKALPYLALVIVALSLFGEAWYDIEIDLETALPFLIALGVTGGALKAGERASKARASLPSPIKEIIDAELKKIKEKQN